MKLRITTSQCIQCDGPLYQPPLSALFNEGLLPVRSCSKLEITAPCPAYLAPARKPAWSVNLPTRNGTTELVPTVNRKGVANVNFLSRFCLLVLPFLQNVLAWEVSWKWHDWIRGEVWRENPCCSVLKARESLYMLLRVSTRWRKKLTVPSPWSSNFQNSGQRTTSRAKFSRSFAHRKCSVQLLDMLAMATTFVNCKDVSRVSKLLKTFKS